MKSGRRVSNSKLIPDPYYGGLNGFERVFQVLDQSCEGLLEGLEKYIS